MRTTLNIDDQLLILVRQFAEQRNISLGTAASFLIHRGLTLSPEHKVKNGFALLSVEPGTSTVGLKDVERALEKEDHSYAQFFTR